MLYILAILMPSIAVAFTGRWRSLVVSLPLGAGMLIGGVSAAVIFPPALLIAWGIWAFHAIVVVRDHYRAKDQEALAAAIAREARRNAEQN